MVTGEGIGYHVVISWDPLAVATRLGLLEDRGEPARDC